MAFTLKQTPETQPVRPPETLQSAENREQTAPLPEGDFIPSREYGTASPTERPKVPPVSAHLETRELPGDPLIVRVENALSQRKKALFAGLPPEVKDAFKTAGEEHARKIADMVRRHAVSPHKVLKGNRKWLSLVPNVKREYLTQEAKIDLDAILDLAEETL